MSNELVVTEVKGTEIAHYGEREVVREIVSRLMAFHPAAPEVGEPGMRMAAQLALLMGASPLPGLNEIHIWKDNKDKILCTPGINYWRRRAEQKGGVRWIERPRPMTEQEAERYGINQNQLGAICLGMRTDEYLECRREGMEYREAVNACGVYGLGVVLKSDYAKNGRPLVWTALKRAEVDLLRQIYPYIPGERLPTAGAGLKVTEHGYEPDLESGYWQDPRSRTLPEGVSIAMMQDYPDGEYDDPPDELVMVLEQPEPATPEQEDEPEPEPAGDDAGPPWDALIADLRAALEESETVTTGELRSTIVATGLYEHGKHVKNALASSKEFATIAKAADSTPVKRAAALRIFDWCISRKMDEADAANGDPQQGALLPGNQYDHEEA